MEADSWIDEVNRPLADDPLPPLAPRFESAQRTPLPSLSTRFPA